LNKKLEKLEYSAASSAPLIGSASLEKLGNECPNLVCFDFKIPQSTLFDDEECNL
jgi:hypothetical protein